MKYSHYRSLLLLPILLICWATSAVAQNVPKTEPNTLVYKLKATASGNANRSSATSTLQQVVQRVATKKAIQKFPNAAPTSSARTSLKNAVDLSLIYELRYTPGQTFEQVKKELLNTGLVEYVEPLYLYEPLQMPNDPKADSVSGSQTYLKQISAYKAWDLTQGDTSVVIGILDTGVRLTHEDLKNNLKYNYNDPIDGADNDGDGFIDNYRGWDMADGDNDPTADANGHGTLVTGIVSAQANNELGIAGIGYKCKFLPIKIFSSSSTGSFKGYEAIVYAADHGCKVINLSWGAASFYSAFEQDVINYAVINKDVVIVAAAGNTNDELDFYPASYDNVLSVAALDKNDVKGSAHTFSYNVDLGALGIGVYTTNNSSDNAYITGGSGSSYSSPMVAGAAALLRSYFPGLNAQQIAERLRTTADDIYTLAGNTKYLEKLGKGRLNVYRALSENSPKSVRVTTWNFTGSSSYEPGAVLQLLANFKNYLSPITGLQVTVSTSSPYLQVVQGSFTINSLETLGNTNNESTPFNFKIAENTPANTQVTVRFGFASGSYTDYQYIKLVLNPDFLTTDVNNLAASIMSTGNIGYDGLNYNQGRGVTFKGSNPLLAEGGLLIGYSPTHVSDNIRNEKGSTDHDFYAITNLQRKVNSPYADFHASNIMEDSLTQTKTKSLRIQQNVFAWANSPNQEFVLLEYILTNRSTETIEKAFAGMFADWDLIAASKNVVEWDRDLNLGITRHISDHSLMTGIQLLSGGAPGFYALDNTVGTGVINLADGFSTQEKYQALSGGIQRDSAGFEGGKDVYFVISSALKTLAPTESDTVAFALVAGESLADLKKNATAALQKYNSLKVGRTVTSVPGGIDKKAVVLYPNPTQGRIIVTLPSALQQTALTVQLVDTRGLVTPLGQFQKKDRLEFDFSNLASGIYYLRLASKEGVITQKLSIAK
ncbi:S8 family serine peptidase [Sabulibacter ruber]|uniref:S8 family serine peptidase n=1 Tax=Sabulibacter ruber TaxID=2811901 RepID=UPI001A96E7BF|nr:S8 family serine peptidase [Sabulibacter ruber]